MDFVYRLLTPSLTKGGLNDHETFNNILAFFQSNAGGTVQEVFPEEFSISQLPTSLEDIDQVINAVSQEDEVMHDNHLPAPFFEEDEGVETELNFPSSAEEEDEQEVEEELMMKVSTVKRRRNLKKSIRKVSKRLSNEAKATYDPESKLYTCPHCNLQLKAGMTNHLKWHKEHPEESYPSRSTCEHCGKTFKKIGILRAHIHRMHSNMPKKFKCTYEGCQRAFKMRGELNTHFLIHTNAKNFICTECGLGFRTKMAMDSHTLRKHTNLKPSIPCEECGKLFKVRSDLYSHAMTHKARKERVHRCIECNLTFRTQQSLDRHRELHDPTRPLACPKCPLRYKNKDQLVRHVQTHEKPAIECDLCHRVFGRPDHLKRHISTKHKSIAPEQIVYFCESVNKKKQKKASTSSSLSHVLPEATPTSQFNLTNVLPVISPKIEPSSHGRTESELATISVAEIATLQASSASTTSFAVPSQFDHYALFHINPANTNDPST